MPAIAISRLYGAGAETIARHLAEALNALYLDRAIISQAARMAGVSESTVWEAQKVPSFLERIAELLGQYPSFEMMMSLPNDYADLPPASVESYRRLIEETIRKEAQDDTIVIVGHGAPIILRDRSDTLRVFIHGSLKARAERLAAEEKLSRAEAEKKVQKFDREWAEFIREYYKEDWRNPNLYDVLVNTDRFSMKMAAEVILAAYRSLPASQTALVS